MGAPSTPKRWSKKLPRLIAALREAKERLSASRKRSASSRLPLTRSTGGKCPWLLHESTRSYVSDAAFAPTSVRSQPSRECRKAFLPSLNRRARDALCACRPVRWTASNFLNRRARLAHTATLERKAREKTELQENARKAALTKKDLIAEALARARAGSEKK